MNASRPNARSQKALQQAYSQILEAQGHSVSVDVPLGSGESKIDLLTSQAMIQCRPDINRQSALALKSQFDFYKQAYSAWQAAVVTWSITDSNAANLLAEAGIKVIVISASAELADKLGATDQIAPQKTPMSSQLVRSSGPTNFTGVGEGGGRAAALCAIAFIFLLGFCGFALSIRPLSTRPSSPASPSI